MRRCRRFCASGRIRRILLARPCTSSVEPRRDPETRRFFADCPTVGCRLHGRSLELKAIFPRPPAWHVTCFSARRGHGGRRPRRDSRTPTPRGRRIAPSPCRRRTRSRRGSRTPVRPSSRSNLPRARTRSMPRRKGLGSVPSVWRRCARSSFDADAARASSGRRPGRTMRTNASCRSPSEIAFLSANESGTSRLRPSTIVALPMSSSFASFGGSTRSLRRGAPTHGTGRRGSRCGSAWTRARTTRGFRAPRDARRSRGGCAGAAAPSASAIAFPSSTTRTSCASMRPRSLARLARAMRRSPETHAACIVSTCEATSCDSPSSSSSYASPTRPSSVPIVRA